MVYRYRYSQAFLPITQTSFRQYLFWGTVRISLILWCSFVVLCRAFSLSFLSLSKQFCRIDFLSFFLLTFPSYIIFHISYGLQLDKFLSILPLFWFYFLLFLLSGRLFLSIWKIVIKMNKLIKIKRRKMEKFFKL